MDTFYVCQYFLLDYSAYVDFVEVEKYNLTNNIRSFGYANLKFHKNNPFEYFSNKQGFY